VRTLADCILSNLKTGRDESPSWLRIAATLREAGVPIGDLQSALEAAERESQQLAHDVEVADHLRNLIDPVRTPPGAIPLRQSWLPVRARAQIRLANLRLMCESDAQSSRRSFCAAAASP
jgi:DNA-binding transcriptional MerR regulator